ncbi:MAG: 50S ribosomal protein L11 methyltransferase [Campylobacter sp.]|nr:50S ribosomal protein L11 methyltransferase [Campylobacter sp.]
MQEKFYELGVKSSNFKDEILDFIFSLGITCVQDEDGWLIVRDEDDLSQVKWGIDEFVSRLSKTLNKTNDLDTYINLKDNKDWINEYKKGVKPIALGDFYIRPSWEKPDENLQNIIIDPALAFGSGHHESTSSCLLFIQKYAKNTFKAIDVGCGSGILSIALCKLGCVVDACDTDELAVQSAKQNAKLNHTNFNQIWTGSISNLNEKYDFVVANIIADVIFVLKNDLKNILKDSAYLVLSGILNKYEKRILEEFSDLKLIQSRSVSEWMSFVFKK